MLTEWLRVRRDREPSSTQDQADRAIRGFVARTGVWKSSGGRSREQHYPTVHRQHRAGSESGQKALTTDPRVRPQSGSGAEKCLRPLPFLASGAAFAGGRLRPPVPPSSSRKDRRVGPGSLRFEFGKDPAIYRPRTVSSSVNDKLQPPALREPPGQHRDDSQYRRAARPGFASVL